MFTYSWSHYFNTNRFHMEFRKMKHSIWLIGIYCVVWSLLSSISNAFVVGAFLFSALSHKTTWMITHIHLGSMGPYFYEQIYYLLEFEVNSFGKMSPIFNRFSDLWSHNAMPIICHIQHVEWWREPHLNMNEMIIYQMILTMAENNTFA